MQVYIINDDSTPGPALEVPDDTTTLPANLTFSAPPVAPENLFVVFDRTVRQWVLSDVEPTVLGAVGYGSSVTILAFRQRFSMAEKQAIELGALDDPSAPMASRAQAAALRAYLGDLGVATFVDLQRADTISSAQQLEAFGLIAEGRAGQILGMPVTWHELPFHLQQQYPQEG